MKTLSQLVASPCISINMFPHDQVPYPERNSWTCSVCDQYNGFGEDGDYNKPIHHIDSIATSFALNKKPKKAAENGLCRTCNLNQVNYIYCLYPLANN